MPSQLLFAPRHRPRFFQLPSTSLVAKRVISRLHRVPPALWFGLVFTLLLAAFVAVLLFEPTVGRGGR